MLITGRLPAGTFQRRATVLLQNQDIPVLQSQGALVLHSLQYFDYPESHALIQAGNIESGLQRLGIQGNVVHSGLTDPMNRGCYDLTQLIEKGDDDLLRLQNMELQREFS